MDEVTSPPVLVESGVTVTMTAAGLDPLASIVVVPPIEPVVVEGTTVWITTPSEFVDEPATGPVTIEVGVVPGVTVTITLGEFVPLP